MNNLSFLKFRPVFNRAARLNKDGKGLLGIEISNPNSKQTRHFSLRRYVSKEQFSNGIVNNHPSSFEYNLLISNTIQTFEKVQTEFLMSHKRYPSIDEFMACIKENSSRTAKLRDFCDTVMKTSDRRESTKRGYTTLLNDIDMFKKNVCVGDIDYNFITKYDAYLKEKVSHNTRAGRHNQLRALLTEAEKREIISYNPYKKFSVPTMKNKKGFLTKEQVEKLKKLRISGKLPVKLRKVLDGFLFCVATGIRFSDFVTLKNEYIQNGWIKKTTIKTEYQIDVPLNLFDGLAIEIMDQYGGDIEKLCRNYGGNGYINSKLKIIFDMIGIEREKKFSFHTSRHTFGTLLLEEGFNETTIQKMMGHAKLSTTQIYSEVTKTAIINDMERVKKNKRGRKTK